MRGDLSKWMQEIATGVYVGNFNSKIRENLWERVQQTVGVGEATLSYACRNEIGYDFKTLNTDRNVMYFDGLPLVQIPLADTKNQSEIKYGFSNASKFHYAKKPQKTQGPLIKRFSPYTVIDIETEGLDHNKHKIIEVAALSVDPFKVTIFSSLIKTNRSLPKEIIQLTGITDDQLNEEGLPIEKVLAMFMQAIGNNLIIGYGVNFDVLFLNAALTQTNMGSIKNKVIDLKTLVKKEKMYLENYKLETVLNVYGIKQKVPHRAIQDTKLIYELSTKVNLFQKMISMER